MRAWPRVDRNNRPPRCAVCCRRRERGTSRSRCLEIVKTLYDKIWDAHIVREESDSPALLYIDLHLVHEVTSPQAYEGLRINDRKVRRPDRTFATVDHAIPTVNRDLPFKDPIAAQQVDTLRRNCREFD